MTPGEEDQGFSPAGGADFPALRALVDRYDPSADRPQLVLVTHVLPTACAYVHSLAAVFDIEIVAIPYSSQEGVVRWMQNTGFRVTRPDRLDALADAALAAVDFADRRGRRVLVQEIGGYLAEHATSLREFPRFCGIVEDTNNGHWRYETQRGELSYPVVSIARSPIKAMEDRQVGHAAAYSVERLIRESFHEVLGTLNVLVVGYGSIGAACAAALRHRARSVEVNEIDPLRIARAALDGFAVGRLGEALGRADVVIGATGRRSLGPSQLAATKRGALVVSVSSKQVEIDLPALQREYQVTPFAASVARYSSGSHHFYLAGDGYPVNFRDHSVLGAALDAIYAELFVCMREVAEGHAGTGLHDSWPALHREVAEAWCSAHLGDALWPGREARTRPSTLTASMPGSAPALSGARHP
jgi:adenosylhomocysteinase